MRSGRQRRRFVGATVILFCATLPASTQTICLYSSSPKSDICFALAAHGFQTTVEAEPVFSTRILRWTWEAFAGAEPGKDNRYAAANGFAEGESFIEV